MQGNEPGADWSSSPEAGPSLRNLAQRVTAILESVERAAGGIIDDAEEEARRYVEESRRRVDGIAVEQVRGMAEVTESLIERADQLKREFDELIQALDEARVRLEHTVRDEAGQVQDDEARTFEASPKGTRSRHLRPLEPEPPEPESAPAEWWRRKHPSDAAGQLLATQMAVAGSSRDQIARCLRDELGIKDVDRILDRILGPERQ